MARKWDLISIDACKLMNCDYLCLGQVSRDGNGRIHELIFRPLYINSELEIWIFYFFN